MTEFSSDAYVDGGLAYLLAQWRRVPEFQRQWKDQWNEGERLSFVMEWDHTEAMLERLRLLKKKRSLNENQRAAWRELESLVSLHGSGIRALVYDDSPIVQAPAPQHPDR